MKAAPELDDCKKRRRTNIGACITMLPSTVNGTELGDQKWRDTLFIRYGIEPPDPPYHCDGCNAKFSICHYLDFKNGGVITTCHNKLRDEDADLAGKSFTHLHVCSDPLIHQGCLIQEVKAQPTVSHRNNTQKTKYNLEKKGDLLVRDLCQRGTDSIHGMHVVNNDALSCQIKSPKKCLQTAEK